MADDLSRTFLGSGPAGYGVSTVMGAILTEWDGVTYANVVSDGAYTFRDCLVLHPSLLVTGRVLLYMTPAGPVILGNTYQKPVTVTVPVDPGTNPDPDPDPNPNPNPNPDPGGGTTTPTSVPWTQTYPDGTAYPTIDGGGTATAVGLSSLASAVSGKVYTYTGPAITASTSVDFTGKSNITIRGITMAQGGMLRPKAGTNIVLEVDAPYELTAGGEIVKWVGVYDRVRIDNSMFGPSTEPTSPTATKNRYIQFGDSTSVGAKFGTVTRSTFRCKAGPGNPVHAAGDTANATGGVRYTLISGNLFQKVRPFDENDHESNLMGISTLQLTDGQQVVEFNRYEDCRSEPEVISMKMNRSTIRGNTFHNCVGSASLRHGDDGEINDNWFFGFQEEVGSGSYNRTSAGPRLYGARHKVHHNTIQVNGNGGSRPSATSLFESPLTLDSGDVAPGSTSNGHGNIVSVLVEKNLLVKCGNPIMVTDNYGTAPTGTVQNNWVVECANTPTDGVGTKGSSPSKAGLTISGNTVYATVAAAGLTTGSGGHFVAPAAADRGARAAYLTAAMVGKGAAYDPWGSTPSGGTTTPTADRTYFGTLVTLRDRVDDERAGGVTISMIEPAWDAWETADGVFSSSYASDMAAWVAALKAVAGQRITLATGLHYTPSYVAGLSNGRYVNQAGTTSTSANFVFNQTVRARAQRYLDQVHNVVDFSSLWSIRLHSGGSAEVLYPDEGGGFWAYDVNAQNGAGRPSTLAQCPFPGWRPGQTSITTAQVRTWLEWYVGCLGDVLAWQMTYFRSKGFTGWFEILTPGSGVRPDGWESAIASRLSPIDDLLGLGAAWDQLYRLMPDRSNCVVYVSSIADGSGGDDVYVPATDDALALTSTTWNARSAMRWQTRIARQYGMRVGGENPGYPGDAAFNAHYADTGSSGLLAKSFAQITGSQADRFYWAHSDRLWPTANTLPFSNYSGRILAKHPDAVSALPPPATP